MAEGDDRLMIEIASPADVRLVVESKTRRKRAQGDVTAKISVNTVTLAVSSVAISMASRIWRDMQSSGDREIRLVDEKTEALIVVLRIAHLQFKKVPNFLTYDELFNVAVVCDRYDTVEFVRPWLSRWEERLRPLAPSKSGHEGWLFISWVFGYSEMYEELAKRLVETCTIDDNGELLSKSGRIITTKMPPGAIGERDTST